MFLDYLNIYKLSVTTLERGVNFLEECRVLEPG
jgi:hypothetical protein